MDADDQEIQVNSAAAALKYDFRSLLSDIDNFDKLDSEQTSNEVTIANEVTSPLPVCSSKDLDLFPYYDHFICEEDKLHECPECGKRIIRLSNMKKHMLTHLDLKRHGCPECGKRFKRLGKMKKHLLTHTGEKPHECPDCGQRFSGSSNMKRHMVTHTGARPHQCPECKKRFSDSSTMKRHLLTHTGEKPHECTECGRKFSRLSHMKRHMMIHMEEDSDPPLPSSAP